MKTPSLILILALVSAGILGIAGWMHRPVPYEQSAAATAAPVEASPELPTGFTVDSTCLIRQGDAQQDGRVWFQAVLEGEYSSVTGERLASREVIQVSCYLETLECEGALVSLSKRRLDLGLISGAKILRWTPSMAIIEWGINIITVNVDQGSISKVQPSMYGPDNRWKGSCSKDVFEPVVMSLVP